MGAGDASLEQERRAWPSFLRGADSGEVLARLGNGDPLKLVEGSARRLRERWILLDPDRVYYRALGVIADAVPCEDPPPDLAEWARVKVDLAIDQLVRADRETETASPEKDGGDDMKFPLLTECLMLDPGLVRAASVAFNALDPLPRRAFFELCVEGREVPDCIESGPWDEDGLYQAIQAALGALALDGQSDPTDPQRRGKRP